MLRLSKTSYSHEDLFIQHYEWLLCWSMRLNGRDKERAEDLVHDAFIQFVLYRPNLNSIQNLEGYLYGMLRNMHLSEIRRASRRRSDSLSVVDYDSAELSLRAADPYVSTQVRDDLRKVCNYACVRKVSSKAGSVLILRYFHGYYPNEMALIISSPRRAVDDWMRIARRETKLYLESPDRLGLLRKDSVTEGFEITAELRSDFLSELRRVIFRSKYGACPSSRQLREVYSSTAQTSVDCALLAHIVSCRDCLDAVNNLLGLPPLSNRYPTDVIGPDAPSGRSKPSSGRCPGDCRPRVEDVLEHEPKELRIVVNGFLLGSHSLGSDVNQQTLSINLDEKIGFVEIFSEQEVRLLYLGVESPPDGTAEQLAQIELSRGRTLTARLNFSESWPKLQTIYHDPQPGPCEAPAEEAAQGGVVKAVARTVLNEERPGRRLLQFWQSLAQFKLLLTPGKVTAVFAMIIVLVLLLVPLRAPTASAAELLRKASASEERAAAKGDLVVHRVSSFEERRPNDGALIARRKVEAWSDLARGIRVRRVYDEKEQIIAADWTYQDGERLVYRRGAESDFRREPSRAGAGVLFEAGDIWPLGLSTKDFSALVGDLESGRVEERPDAYVVTYQGISSDGPTRLLKATLTLTKPNLHAVSETLLVEREGVVIEYRFGEKIMERVSPKAVAPSVFQVDPELSRRSLKRSETDLVRPPLTGGLPATAEATPISAAALIDLKVELLYALHNIGACMRDQVSMGEADNGGLLIQAVVETERRKQEVLKALDSVTQTHRVRIEVNTMAEAVKQQLRLQRVPSVARRVEITKGDIQAYDELRRHFVDQISHGAAVDQSGARDKEVDENVRRFANAMLMHSRQSLLQAWVLKHHTDDLAGLITSQTQAKWRAMIREHLAALERELRMLGIKLRPVFSRDIGSSEHNGDAEFHGASEMGRAIEQLFRLVLSLEESIRRAFAISSDRGEYQSIRTENFWKTLESAERLAKKIQRGL
jgi:RNA polymerase sigma factor (sigma-70 family)